MFKKISKILNLATKINIGLILFSIPIFFSPPFFKINNVFELPKNTLFHFLVLSLLFLTIVDFLFYREKAEIDSIKKVIKKNKFIFFSIFFYVLTLVLAFVFSDFKTKSFFGSYSRQMGLLTYLYYILFFFLYLFRRKNSYKKDLLLLVFSSFLVSVYGIMQSMSLDFTSWSELTYLRIISTMGQPNFLGMFLALSLSLNVFFFFEIKKIYRYFFLFSFAISFLAIGYTYSFTTWIGLSLSGLILIILLIYKKKLILFKKNVFFFLVIFFSFLLLFFYLIFSNSYTFKMKLGAIFNPESGSTAARINYWSASLKGIVKKPVFGYGLDTQGEIIPKFYQTDWAVHSNIGVTTNRAHNFILDYLLTVGVLGLLAYLYLLFVFFRVIFLNIKNNEEVLLNYSIAFSLLSYICILLFNFPIIITELFFWFYFAIVLSIHFSSEDNAISPALQGDVVQSINYLKIIFKILILVSSILLLSIWAKKEIKTIIADKYLFDIKGAYFNNQYFKSLVLFDYIRDLNLKTDYYNIEFGKILSDWTPEIEQYGKIYNIKGREYMLSIYEQLNDTEYNKRLSKVNMLAVLSMDDDSFSGEAEERFIDLINDYPGIPQNYYNLANFYYHLGKLNDSEIFLKKEFEKIPDINNKNLNNDHRSLIKEEVSRIYTLLGDISYKKNNYETAIEYYMKSNSVVEKSAVHRKIADVFIKKDDYSSAVWHAKRAIGIDDDNFICYYYLAQLYYDLNEYEESKKYLDKSLYIFPKYSDSLKLKKALMSVL